MTLEEYRVFLSDAREMGRDAVLPFMECVHLWALGYCCPEVKSTERWKVEFAFAKERWGTDARFEAARREAIAEIQSAQRGEGRWPDWAHLMAKLRFGVDVDSSRVSVWEKIREEQRGRASGGEMRFPTLPCVQGGPEGNRLGCPPS